MSAIEKLEQRLSPGKRGCQSSKKGSRKRELTSTVAEKDLRHVRERSQYKEAMELGENIAGVASPKLAKKRKRKKSMIILDTDHELA